MQITHYKSAAMKAAVVLVPSYLAAYLSDKMVWVVPTLTASSFFAATIGLNDEGKSRLVDNENQDNQTGSHHVHHIGNESA